MLTSVLRLTSCILWFQRNHYRWKHYYQCSGTHVNLLCCVYSLSAPFALTFIHSDNKPNCKGEAHIFHVSRNREFRYKRHQRFSDKHEVAKPRSVSCTYKPK